jgi:hypothetical protein
MTANKRKRITIFIKKMAAVLKNGIVYIDLEEKDENQMKKADILKEWEQDSDMTLLLNILFELFGNTDYKLGFNTIVTKPAFDSFQQKATLVIKQLYEAKPDKSELVKKLACVFFELMKEGQDKQKAASSETKVSFKLQEETFIVLYTFVCQHHQAFIASERINAFFSCQNFSELIDRFGRKEELMSQYKEGLLFAPDKKRYIETKIANWEDNTKKVGATVDGVSLGEYKRIGFAWANNGYNADKEMLSCTVTKNVNINAIVPLDRRNNVFITMFQLLAEGGAVAFHIAFLRQELNKLSVTLPQLPAGLSSTVHQLQFHLLQGYGFERLTFTYLLTLKKWDHIDWLGETGDDGGKDIWAEIDGYSTCFQCANYQKLEYRKIADDIDKLVMSNSIPDAFVVIAGGSVSRKTREKIIEKANLNGVSIIEIWNGVKFEEMLRQDRPDLIERFFMGIPFPKI